MFNVTDQEYHSKLLNTTQRNVLLFTEFIKNYYTKIAKFTKCFVYIIKIKNKIDAIRECYTKDIVIQKYFLNIVTVTRGK